ncbi:MAG: LysR family transcriptional regulator [Rhodospirillaceae bacterium]|nr:LysR family transcriptional regulator [Rhodospirillaceae bacterium]MBT5244684.1 LysR family transcriptional regulator [Rhodospirillaceae bacterium]MBT5562425.1 LysR family transcriptional regulator [Rhodospirillaceae bacterium]MBT6242063.1 LysR family transcriptional regulator [Rhodospirillaceae bacterium]
MSLLKKINVFVRVIELGSLSAAGRDLRISAAVASHRIKELEKHLGVRLFNRTTRRLQPTEHGTLYYEGCQGVLRALEEAEASVVEAGARPRGSLRVTAPLGLGRRILSKSIPRFHDAFPEITIWLRLSDHRLDLMKEGVDVAIRLSGMRDSSLTMRKILNCQRLVCASPEYLEKKGKPSKPEDLLDHECLLLRFSGEYQSKWVLGKSKLPVSGSFDADDGDLLTAWALDGMGIVLKPLFEVAEHLRSGALVPLLLDTPPEPVDLAVLYPHRRLLASKVKVFSEFMIEECKTGILDALGGLTLDQLPR